MRRTNEAAAALRRTLEDPIYNKTLRKEVGRGELDYEVYVRTRELLALQTPASELVIPDELLFQVMHQTQELWLKCAAFETANLVEHLDEDAVFGALEALDRVVGIAQVLRDQIRVLFTLSPSRFQVIRRSLGNGSGLESPGYNQLLAAADAAAGALGRMLGRRGATLLDVYRQPEAHPDLHRISERFVDWDAGVQGWLVEHFTLVRRTIGVDKTVRALDGFPTVALGARMMKPLFADLWNVRVEMTKGWSREGGYAVGAERGAAPEEVAPVTVPLTVPQPPPPPAPAPVVVAAPPAPPPPRIEAAVDRERRQETEDMIPLVRPGKLREQFPLLARCVYLNSNATGAAPLAAKAALDEYWRTMETWRDEAWEGWFDEMRGYTDELAALIGAPAGSVITDSNVSTLFSRVMSCFDYRQRPRVVTSDLEFPAIPHIVRAFSRYGAEAVIVPSPDGTAIDPERMIRAIDERTQLVCVSHATFETGALLDLTPIVRRCRQVGALIAVDAYQSVGVVPIDVLETGVDFLLGGAHKWLCGSYESAFLYVRPGLVGRLQPAASGWIASSDPMSFAAPTGWADGVQRFAGGTPAVLPVLYSRPGLAIIRELGVEAVRCLSLAQTEHIMQRAEDAKLAVVTPRPYARRGGIVALRFPNDDQVTRELIAAGFVCSHRGALRIAPHFYNTDEEVDRFMDELVRRVRGAS